MWVRGDGSLSRFQAALLTDPRLTVLVAMSSDDRPVGMAGFELRSPTEAWVWVFVPVMFRHRGVATEIMRVLPLHEELLEATLRVVVDPGNIGMIRAAVTAGWVLGGHGPEGQRWENLPT